MCSRKGNRLQVAAEADGFALDDDLVHVLSNEDDGGERGIFGAQLDVVFKKEYPLERCIGLDQDGGDLAVLYAGLAVDGYNVAILYFGAMLSPLQISVKSAFHLCGTRS